MQYDIDRMQYEMDHLRRQRTASSLDGSTGSQPPDDVLGQDDNVPIG